jgi:hypothetical protein
MPSKLLSCLIRMASDKEIAELNNDALLEMFSSDTDDIWVAILPRIVKAAPKARLKRLLSAYEDYSASRYYTAFYWLDLGIFTSPS